MKKLCITELLGMQTLNQFAPIRQQERNQFLQMILKKAKAGEAVDVQGELIRLTNNLMTRITMSKRCSENEDDAGEVRKYLQEIRQLSRKFNLADYIWFCKNLDLQGFGKRVKEARKKFDKIMEKIMKDHEEARRKKKEMSGEGDAVKDLLDILLAIMEDEKAEMRLTGENVKGIIMDIFSAGTDTSASTMEWALAELINHPNMMDKARQEIDSMVGKDRLVEEFDIVNLPYLQAIVKETLRLHPAGPLIVRESSKECTVGGYDVPAKTLVFVNVWAIGRDPNHWENPLEFSPGRFLNEDGSINKHLDVRGQRFKLLPFGSGRRVCPGTSLALQVVQTSLASMIQCFEWKVGDKGSGTVDMEEGPASGRANPLVCVPVARLNPFPIDTR
ncbi:hypothetical protein PVL29_010936 [Vitis rotundifolia]|nr:hypothetical protein PVL29_010936 [Vitis rotundifolia]